jgi:1-pyrroline-4-hydroxy-2-carboxylate deaminase
VTRLSGFVPPIATPFRDGRLDVESLHRMLDDLGDSVTGFLVGGSVGETASLTIEERIGLLREVAAHVDGEYTIAFSISDNAIENSRRLAEAAGEIGVAVLMASCPNYYANDRAMLVEYFAALSDLASADLCLYDNPIASHTTLSVADIGALAESAPRLTHVKVTDLALGKVEALRAETSLVVLAGDDAVLWNQVAGGAEGAMVALPMIYPERSRELWHAFAAGDLDTARQEYRHVTNFIHIALGGPDYVAVIKAVLHHRGVIVSPEVRPPLRALDGARHAEVVASL